MFAILVYDVLMPIPITDSFSSSLIRSVEKLDIALLSPVTAELEYNYSRTVL